MIASHCFNSLMTTICSFFYAQCKYDVILCESESVVCNHLSTWSLQPYICSRFLQPSKNMSLNKEWMKAPRNSFEYLEGVESFIEFIRANKDEFGDDDWYCCPCVKCCNLIWEKKPLGEIQTHLICDGIDKTYTTWIHHGELHPRSRVNVGAGTNNEDWFPRMVDMVNDIFGCARNEDDPESHVGGSTSICPDEANDQGFVEGREDSPKNIRYKKLMEDVVKPLYPSCRVEHTKLSVTVDLLSMKARYQWSTKSFTELLEMIKDILPS